MNVLYYGDPDVAHGGGVGKVAYYLPRALNKKACVTYFHGLRSSGAAPGVYVNILTRFLKKDFDIIHFIENPVSVNGSSLLLRSAKLRQARTILSIHGIPHLELSAERLPRSISFNIWLNILQNIKMADKIVVNSDYMRNNVIKWYRLQPCKIAIIPNGVDLEIFNSKAQIPLEGDPSILYIGHFSRLKGVDILIQAIAKVKAMMPNVKLHLVGRGNKAPFRHLARQLNIENSVIFHDWASQSTVASFYKSADICVFPSRLEGFGIVVLEAMASGVPIIASGIPSFRELISNRVNGCLFEPENADALSKEIINLYQDGALRKRIVQNEMHKVKSYSWQNIAEQYLSLYKEVIAESYPLLRSLQF